MLRASCAIHRYSQFDAMSAPPCASQSCAEESNDRHLSTYTPIGDPGDDHPVGRAGPARARSTRGLCDQIRKLTDEQVQEAFGAVEFMAQHAGEMLGRLRERPEAARSVRRGNGVRPGLQQRAEGLHRRRQGRGQPQGQADVEGRWRVSLTGNCSRITRIAQIGRLEHLRHDDNAFQGNHPLHHGQSAWLVAGCDLGKGTQGVHAGAAGQSLWRPVRA